MKIAIVTNYQTYHIDRLLLEGRKRNIETIAVPYKGININNIENDPLVKLLKKQNIVIFRGSETIIRLALGNILNKYKIKYINSGYYTNNLLSNKAYQAYQASLNEITTPKTIVTEKEIYKNFKFYFNYLSLNLGLPFISKLAIGGSLGKKIYLVNNFNKFQDLIKKEKTRLKDFLFQEFIPNNGDYRVYVINHKAVETFKRVPKKGEFRANISLGGTGKKVKNNQLRKNLYQLAEKITLILNLEIAGIDIIKSTKNKKLYFIESNSVAQWQGLQQTTETDIAKKIFNYLETLV